LTPTARVTLRPSGISTVGRALVSLGLLLAFVAFSGAGARAAPSKEAIKTSIEKTYNVKVLRIQEGEQDDRSVYRVTFMNHGGNDNAAFQVNTIVVDAETGKRVPQFRHLASGYRLPAALDRTLSRQATDALRGGRTWRGGSCPSHGHDRTRVRSMTGRGRGAHSHRPRPVTAM